jgi:hypothetical protein
MDMGRAFPELLQTLRGHAGISLEEVATARTLLRDIDLPALEDDTLDVLQMPSDVIVALMEEFSISLRVLENSLKRLIAQRRTRSALGTSLRRTAGDLAPELLEKAMRDVADVVAQKKGTVRDVDLPKGFLDRIRRLLIRWGREDLL